MVSWQNTPSTATPLNAANLDAAFAEKADAAATTAGLALKVDLTDARLTDTRTPTAHTQTASTITDFTTAVNTLIAGGGGTRSKAIPAVGTAVVTTSGAVASLLATLVVPDQGCAGTLMVSSKVHFLSSPPDVYGVFMLSSAAEVGTDRQASASGGNMANCSAQVAMVAGSAKTVTLNIARFSGTGTASADATTTALGSIWALFVPA